jgi:nitroreductase
MATTPAITGCPSEFLLTAPILLVSRQALDRHRPPRHACAMEFYEALRRRRMVRNYRDEPVDPEALQRILAAGLRAPSAGFSQGWAFLVLDEPDDVAAFWETNDDGGLPDSWLSGMRRAPVLVVPCSSKAAYLSRYAEADKGWTDQDEARWPMPFWHMDTAMAVMLMLGAVVEEGLGACYFGIMPEYDAAVRSRFDIPADHDPIGVVSIGHRADGGAKGSPSTRKRRTLDEIVHRGSW